MPELFDREFLFVTGKGGVGKTTVSAALALAAAARGKRVLVAMCNAKERLSHLLEVDSIGARNMAIGPNLEAVNMTPTVALEEYGMMVLKVRSVYKAIFENRFVAAVLRGTPGIEAWAMLGKAYFHTDEQLDDGRPRYDLVIVDGPATGHALDMLRVPQVICDVAPPGLLRAEAEKALSLFRDAKRSAAVLVTLPEDMPANETLELHDALRNEIRMPVGELVVNSVLSKLFKSAERAPIAELPTKIGAGSPAHSLVMAGRQRALREGMQQQAIAKLKEGLPELPRTVLPMLHTPEFRRSAIESLAECFR
ncbi:MAG TPA: ArsA family ATPase [Sandaracinaceae bacterium LLY-WYZ-13_1]|nr:ArsA family ATPase [Sandaracinaceae bacterium LLY-WYZ-13_1]